VNLKSYFTERRCQKRSWFFLSSFSSMTVRPRLFGSVRTWLRSDRTRQQPNTPNERIPVWPTSSYNEARFSLFFFVQGNRLRIGEVSFEGSQKHTSYDLISSAEILPVVIFFGFNIFKQLFASCFYTIDLDRHGKEQWETTGNVAGSIPCDG